MNTLHYNSCNSRSHEPTFTQLAQKINNILLFRLILVSHHISVAALHSTKCLSIYWPSLILKNVYEISGGFSEGVLEKLYAVCSISSQKNSISRELLALRDE